MEYTKGEWKADIDILDNGEFRCLILDDEQCEIAKVNGYQGNGDGRESEANTYLIAAAPDMYGALKEARRNIDLTGYVQVSTIVNFIDKALAKAEGKGE